MTVRIVRSERRYQPYLQALLQEQLAGLPPAQRLTVEKNLTLEAESLPTPEHNRLLRCWVKRDGNQLTPQTAVYSPMSDRQHHISPVVIDSSPVSALSAEEQQEASDGLAKMVNLFHAYWISAKAEAEERQNPRPARLLKKSQFRDETLGYLRVERMIREEQKKV